MGHIEKYTGFMLESNKIEGEPRLNPNDLDVMDYVINNGIHTEEDLHKVWNELTEHTGMEVGYRRHDVRVGRHIPPGYHEVQGRMDNFFRMLPELTPFEAHNLYECIHPFEDFNGRTGRLIWLSKMDPWSFSIPFLQMYYYQALEYWQQK